MVARNHSTAWPRCRLRLAQPSDWPPSVPPRIARSRIVPFMLLAPSSAAAAILVAWSRCGPEDFRAAPGTARYRPRGTRGGALLVVGVGTEVRQTLDVVGLGLRC